MHFLVSFRGFVLSAKVASKNKTRRNRISGETHTHAPSNSTDNRTRNVHNDTEFDFLVPTHTQLFHLQWAIETVVELFLFLYSRRISRVPSIGQMAGESPISSSVIFVSCTQRATSNFFLFLQSFFFYPRGYIEKKV